MSLTSVCVLALVLNGAFSEDALLHPCSKSDIACLSETARGFLERTSSGIAEYDIKPIDPWVSQELKVPVDGGVSVTFNNVSVTGLKNLQIDNFKIDSNTKSVVLGMRDNAEISGDIVVEKAGKNASGVVSGKQNRLVTAKYNYDLVPDDKGVEYFRVGVETLTCDLDGKADIKLNEDVAKLLLDDESAAEETKKKLVCSIIVAAYSDVMHNLRASAKIYSKTAYFTDLL